MNELIFLYLDELKQIITEGHIDYDLNEVEETRGLYCLDTKDVFIHLGALQWTETLEVHGEDKLIEEISLTIQHEYCHKVIETKDFKNYTEDGEERIIRNMIGQVS